MVSRFLPLRILVHSDMVGAIIGRTGSTIRTITKQTNARIDVHREESPEQQEKVITINGNPDDCSEACFRILEVIQNEKNTVNDGVFEPNRDITLKMLAPSNLIGRLIGRSGSTIKKIMEQTSTRINISANNITDSTGEHTITVVGRLDQVRLAGKLIFSKLRTDYMSDVYAAIPMMAQGTYLFNDFIPYMSNTCAQSSILSSMSGGSQTGHSGNAMSRNMPMTNHQGPLSGQVYGGMSNYLPLHPNMSVPQSTTGLLGYNTVVSSFGNEKETVYIHIPSTMVGAIIGKSGTAIKDMIHTSGASIKVETAPIAQPGHCQVDEQKKDSIKAKEASVDNANDTKGNEDCDSRGATGAAQESASDIPHPLAPQAAQKTSHRQVGQTENQVPTRKVTIVGFAASQYSAQYMIYRKVAMETKKSDISLMVEIHVPSHLVGKIIGKGGSTVKQLQKQTRTTIRLPDDKAGHGPNGDSSESCVQITGEFEGSLAAQRHIRFLIKEGLSTRQNKQNRNNESGLGVKNNAQSNTFNSMHIHKNGNLPTKRGEMSNPSCELVTKSNDEKKRPE